MTELALPEAELSILLVDDPQIQALNWMYLHRDRPTNVLAFPMGKGRFPLLHSHLIGDVVISVETAEHEKGRFGLDLSRMILLLMIHGILHLIGYDHEKTKKQAREMSKKQKELLQRMIQDH